MGMRFVPPLLLVAVIATGPVAPAAAKSLEPSVEGARVTAANATGAKKRGVANRANAPQVAAKERSSPKVANERNGLRGADGSRARRVQSATKGGSGANGQRSVDAANGSNTGSNAQCSSETRQQLERSVTALGEPASRMGICQLAHESMRLHTALASYHNRCGGPKGQIRASEFDRAAAQAQETARARCTPMTVLHSTPTQLPSPPPPRPTVPSRPAPKAAPAPKKSN
jgi:hypothetical protein